MDKKIKTKWLKALRSGKYKQAKGYLFDGEGHCCLGVLCRVMGMKPRKKYGTYIFGRDAERRLPPSIMRKTGVGELGGLHHPVILDGVTLGTLSQLNDYGFSFKRIASIIEKHL